LTVPQASLCDDPVVWLESRVVLKMTAEADRVFPRETGGILIGYGDERSRQSVVCACVGPGPRAIHGRSSFLPDHTYHQREAARLYAASGRVLSYLGDWHSHPCGGASLSWRDKRTLARIARSAGARAPRPLMVVLAGAPIGEHCLGHQDFGGEQNRVSQQHAARLGGWLMVAWQLEQQPSRFDAAFARVAPAQARVFSQQAVSDPDPS
jgi:integrative and conjugative element protein (TIGR02256 family)